MIGCLIIHGYTGGPYEVAPLQNYLKENTDWKIDVPVLTGHGYGYELDLKDASYEVWLDEAEMRLLQLQEECDAVYVIGFSMGGMIAAYLAAKHHIEKLVLLATARKVGSLKYLSYDIAEMIGDGFKGKLHENETYLHYKSKQGLIPIKANIEFMKLVNRTKPYLKDIDSPVFIAQGHKDEMVPLRSAYSLEEEIGSDYKEVVFFEESDHLICLGDNKEVLNEMVLTFLKNDITSETEESAHM